MSQAWKEYHENNKDRFLNEMLDLLRIPSISADPAYAGDVRKTAEAVADHLKAAGADLKDFAPFPDHAAFREEDLRFLAGRADQFGARLITTEKDWSRLPPRWRERVVSWPVKATFDDEAGFAALLGSAAPLHRSSGGPPPPAGEE